MEVQSGDLRSDGEYSADAGRERYQREREAGRIQKIGDGSVDHEEQTLLSVGRPHPDAALIAGRYRPDDE